MKSNNKSGASLRIVRRTPLNGKKSFVYYVVAVLTALLIGGILLLCLKINPFEFYKEMITIGMLDNIFAYKNVEGFIKLFVLQLY